MAKTLDRTKDIFLDTMLLGNEILIKKIKTTSKTKITVVLAAFRNLDRLSKILKDLFKQTITDFEIIIVDDSSTFEIEEFVAINDNRKINYIKKSNRQVSLKIIKIIKYGTPHLFSHNRNSSHIPKQSLQIPPHLIQ